MCVSGDNTMQSPPFCLFATLSNVMVGRCEITPSVWSSALEIKSLESLRENPPYVGAIGLRKVSIMSNPRESGHIPRMSLDHVLERGRRVRQATNHGKNEIVML